MPVLRHDENGHYSHNRTDKKSWTQQNMPEKPVFAEKSQAHHAKLLPIQDDLVTTKSTA